MPPAPNQSEPFQQAGHYWFPVNQPSKRSRKAQKYLAGHVTRVDGGHVEWHWLYDPHSTVRRDILSLLARQARRVTECEQTHLTLDSNFSLADINFQVQHNILEEPYAPGPSPPHYALHGFHNIHNHNLWHSLLEDFLPQFNPLVFTDRRVRSEPPPPGPAQRQWTNSNKALLNLLSSTEVRADDGSYISTVVYDQLHMLHYSLPALLLQVPPFATHAQKTKIICSNCTRFLEGSWRSLVTEATREIAESNAQAQAKAATRAPSAETDRDPAPPAPTLAGPPPPASDTEDEPQGAGAGAEGCAQPPGAHLAANTPAARRNQLILGKVRAMQYSRAMNHLRSNGLASGTLNT